MLTLQTACNRPGHASLNNVHHHKLCTDYCSHLSILVAMVIHVSRRLSNPETEPPESVFQIIHHFEARGMVRV